MARARAYGGTLPPRLAVAVPNGAATRPHLRDLRGERARAGRGPRRLPYAGSPRRRPRVALGTRRRELRGVPRAVRLRVRARAPKRSVRRRAHSPRALRGRRRGIGVYGCGVTTIALPVPRRTGSAAASSFPPPRNSIPVAAPISDIVLNLWPRAVSAAASGVERN